MSHLIFGVSLLAFCHPAVTWAQSSGTPRPWYDSQVAPAERFGSNAGPSTAAYRRQPSQPPAYVAAQPVPSTPREAGSYPSPSPWYTPPGWPPPPQPTGRTHAYETTTVEDDHAYSDFVCGGDLQNQYQATCRTLGQRCGLQFDNPAWRAGGWLQQGVTWNAAGPQNRLNVPVLFNDQANGYQLNQLYFYLAKDVCVDGPGWDLGGRVDVNLGTDSRFVTVPGLEEHENRTAKWNGEDAEYGIAIPQAYVEVGTPLGPYGSSLRVGHFYALGGYETFAAPDNFFYSHAYTYLYGEPFTFSGGMLLMKVSETAAVSLAGTTGWDALDGTGDEWGVRFGLMKTSVDGRTSAAVTFHSGRDFTGITTAGGPQGAPRHWASLVLKRFLTDRLHYVLQSDYGYQEDSVLTVDTVNNTIGFGAGQWWGVNQYLVYDFHENWSAGLRAEWFRDQDNTRVGVPVTFASGGPTFQGQDYFALTAGLHWKPHTNVRLRQEIRWDFSNVESNPNAPGVPAGVRPFNDRRDDNQLTLALDLILIF